MPTLCFNYLKLSRHEMPCHDALALERSADRSAGRTPEQHSGSADGPASAFEPWQCSCGADAAARQQLSSRGLPLTACEAALGASVLTSTALFVDVIRAQLFGWFWAVFSARRRPIAAAFVPVWSPAIMAFLCQWVCCMRLPRCRVTRENTYCPQFRLWH